MQWAEAHACVAGCFDIQVTGLLRWDAAHATDGDRVVLRVKNEGTHTLRGEVRNSFPKRYTPWCLLCYPFAKP